MAEEKRLSKMSTDDIKKMSSNFAKELLLQYRHQYGLEDCKIVLNTKGGEK